MNVALFGNRDFADNQVKLKSLGRALIQYDCVLIKRGNLGTSTSTRGEHHVNLKAEIRVMHLKVNQCQRLPEISHKLEESMEHILSQQPQEKPTLPTT